MVFWIFHIRKIPLATKVCQERLLIPVHVSSWLGSPHMYQAILIGHLDRSLRGLILQVESNLPSQLRTPTKTNMTGWKIHHEWWRCFFPISTCFFKNRTCYFSGRVSGIILHVVPFRLLPRKRQAKSQTEPQPEAQSQRQQADRGNGGGRVPGCHGGGSCGWYFPTRIPVLVDCWVGKFCHVLAGITHNGFSTTEIPSGSLVKCVYFRYQQPSAAKNMGFACCQDCVVAPKNSWSQGSRGFIYCNLCFILGQISWWRFTAA